MSGVNVLKFPIRQMLLSDVRSNIILELRILNVINEPASEPTTVLYHIKSQTCRLFTKFLKNPT